LLYATYLRVCVLCRYFFFFLFFLLLLIISIIMIYNCWLPVGEIKFIYITQQ